MDSLFFHPKVVHIPIALGVLMPLIAAGVLVAWWRDLLPRRAWVGVVALQAILVASGIVAIQTGQEQEERVEHVVAEQRIHAHEEAAEQFTWGAGVVLAICLLPLLLAKESAQRAAAGAAVAGTLVVLGLGYRAGDKGGELVYRYGAAAAYTAGSGTGSSAGAAERASPGTVGEDDDDDD